MKKEKQFSQHLPVVLIPVLVLAVLLSGFYLYRHFNGAMAAGSGREITVDKNMDNRVGTEDNPYLIVEIVPNLSCAEIGYLIPGQEPVSLYQLGTSTDCIPFLKRMGCNVSSGIGGTITTSPNAIMTAKTTSFTRFEDEPHDDADSFSGWTLKNETITVEGYYQRVTSGTGHFDLVDDRYGKKSIVKNDAGDGNFEWVTEENTQKIVTDYSSDKIWTTRTEDKYYEGTKINIINNDVFVKNVMDSTSEEFKVKVVTLTPEELQNPVNVALLDQANMFYINGTAHASSETATDTLVDVWKTYNVAGTDSTHYTMTAAEEANTSFVVNDLPWDVCKKIYERMAKSAVTVSGAAITNGTYGKPILVMDGVSDFYGIANRETGLDKVANKDCLNVYKLYMMTKQYSPAKFYDTFYNPVASGAKKVEDDNTVSGKKTGKYNSNNIWVYKDDKTFFESGMKTGKPRAELLNAGIKASWIDADSSSSYESAEDGIYVFDKTTSMLDTFLDAYVDRSADHKYDHNKIVFDWYDDNAADGSKKTTLSSAEILKALYNINLEYKRELNILEVQPTNDFKYNAKDTASIAYFTKMFPWFEGGSSDIHVTQMATWEFVGNIDDIVSKYDVVYIGARPGKVDIDNRNDNRLKGYTYIPVGDSTSKNQNNTSYASKDVRYSDNDISKSKYKELKAFMDAGKPIVFEDSFYNGNSTTVSKAAWHQGTEETYMYKLANLANDSNYYNKTLFRYKDLVTSPVDKSVAAMRKASYKDLCKLVFYDSTNTDIYPKQYSYTTTSSDGRIASENYNTYSEEVSGKSERTLRYRFMIKGEKGATYSVRLFIDSNADGVYRGSINRPMTYDPSGTAITESEEVPDSSMQIKSEKGNKVSTDNLKANTWYVLSRPLGDLYKGIIPWKLEVSQNTAANRTWSNLTDYTLFKVAASDKEDVNIIQLFVKNRSTYINVGSDGFIKKNDGGGVATDGANDKSKSSMSLDTGTVTCKYENDYKFDITGTISTPGNNPSGANNKFKRYLSGVQEFNVNIKFFDSWDIPNIMCGYTKATESFRNKVSGSTGSDPTAWWNADPSTPYGKPSAKRLTAWLDSQNIGMIIFGYSDSQSYPDNKEFHKAMKQYIDVDEKAVIFCHDQVCSYMGGGSGSTTDINNNDMRFWVGQNRYESLGLWSKGTTVGSTLKLNGMFDVRMRPLNADGTPIKKGGSTDDYTFFDDNSNVIDMKIGKPSGGYKDRDTHATGSWPLTTQKVRMANEGQITNYPYKIKKIISTGTTHTQYFQLDVENDDITTWFTLSDSNSKLIDTGSNAGRGFYSSRDGDVKNSFYIYNKGNITYTGMGHQTNMTNEEVQLFVNTMISAFRRTPEQPYAALVDEDGTVIDKNGVGDVDYQINVVKDEVLSADQQYAVIKFKILDNSIGLSAKRNYEIVFNYYDKNGDLQKMKIPFDCRSCTYDTQNYMATPGHDGLRESATGAPVSPSVGDVTDATTAGTTGGVKYKVDSNTGYEIYIPLSEFYDLKDASGNALGQITTNDAAKKILYSGSFLYNIQVYSRVSTSTYKKNNTVEDTWIQLQEMKQFNLD
ncbi:MAG: DUF5057 domain-containing protein [Clostridiales bacterium]|nr:DUF5057 domain-containing protein [Clostridiales bacterium]